MPGKPEHVDGYIRERLAAGERSALVIAKELTRARLCGMTAAEQLELLEPVVRAYAENRVRGWRRAIDNMAGRDSASASEGTQPEFQERRATWGPAPMTALQARQARLNETTYVPGYGAVWNRDLTREQIGLAIAHLEGSKRGIEKSIAFLRRCRTAMDKHGVSTFGEVPLSEPLDL